MSTNVILAYSNSEHWK